MGLSMRVNFLFAGPIWKNRKHILRITLCRWFFAVFRGLRVELIFWRSKNRPNWAISQNVTQQKSVSDRDSSVIAKNYLAFSLLSKPVPPLAAWTPLTPTRSLFFAQRAKNSVFRIQYSEFRILNPEYWTALRILVWTQTTGLNSEYSVNRPELAPSSGMPFQCHLNCRIWRFCCCCLPPPPSRSMW